MIHPMRMNEEATLSADVKQRPGLGGKKPICFNSITLMVRIPTTALIVKGIRAGHRNVSASSIMSHTTNSSKGETHPDHNGKDSRILYPCEAGSPSGAVSPSAVGRH
jgi:hypothetical protein